MLYIYSRLTSEQKTTVDFHKAETGTELGVIINVITQDEVVYAKEEVIGKGSFATVYRGVPRTKGEIPLYAYAVKKSNDCDETDDIFDQTTVVETKAERTVSDSD